MVHEISQFDIPDRQLLASNKQPGLVMLTDIGEAKISRTIFGRAKVRVVRERDKKRRAWLLSALAVMALSAAAWQGWLALQRSELLVAQLPLSERIKVSAPVFNTEDAIPSDDASSSKRRQKTPTQILFDSMATHRPPEPQQIPGKAPGQNVAKPAAAPIHPATTADATHPEVKSVAPAVATSPDTQGKAEQATTVIPPADSIIREDARPLAPAGGDQPSGTSGSQY